VHARVHGLLAGVEAILHAGDVGSEVTLAELRLIAPIHAIAGNVDTINPDLPLQRVVELPFGKAALMHGHMGPQTRGGRLDHLMEILSPHEPRLILFGHTHAQYLELRQGVWLINPGSAGRPRFAAVPSLMTMEWDSVTDEMTFTLKTFDW